MVLSLSCFLRSTQFLLAFLVIIDLTMLPCTKKYLTAFLMDAPFHNHPSLVLVAGGSGGHMFPAIAVAEASFKSSLERAVILITDGRGARFLTESSRSLFHAIHVLPSSAFLHYRTVLTLIQCMRILRHLPCKPCFVIGFGGKMSVLPLIAARLLRIPSALHQSDCIMGKANARLSYGVNVLFLGFRETLGVPTQALSKVVYLGTPVRSAFHAVAPLSLPDSFHAEQPLQVLVLGGSQGARFWCDALPKALLRLSKDQQRSIHLIHQCREDEMDVCQKAYKATESVVELVPFIVDMPSALGWAHCVLSRAGASSMAELMSTGRPAFFVPYPFATRDHQNANASKVIQAMGLHPSAWIGAQDEVIPEKIARFLRQCLHNPSMLRYAGEIMRTQSHPHAASQLASFCWDQRHGIQRKDS
jgi:UDP-N-acetylglucosamine--N-acetylmuramyl-(pentapeptide) pyrophosphoryl-undecaprenol N-acetylglucosamine transferase